MSDLPLAPLLGLQGLTIEVLDIGPMPDAPGRYAALADQGLARVTAVEPAAENAAALLARGVARILPVFLGDGGPARLHVTRDPGYSGLFEPRSGGDRPCSPRSPAARAAISRSCSPARSRLRGSTTCCPTWRPT
ncbi:MAG: hypothetical protein WDO24_17305 [Pseudomonadota bacterium]